MKLTRPFVKVHFVTRNEIPVSHSDQIMFLLKEDIKPANNANLKDPVHIIKHQRQGKTIKSLHFHGIKNPIKRQIKFPTKGRQLLPETLAARSAKSCTQEISSGNPHLSI